MTKLAPQQDYRVGIPPHWSLLPLEAEYRRLNKCWQIVSDKATTLSHLQQGQLDLAFLPATSLLSEKDIELALPLGEVYRRSVGTAYLCLSRDESHVFSSIQDRIDDIRRVFAKIMRQYDTDDMIHLIPAIWQELSALGELDLPEKLRMRCTTQAPAWGSLARLMYRMIFGERHFLSNEMLQSCGLEESSVEDSSLMELHCGNRAIASRCTHGKVIDLAELWTDLTGLPFVASVLLKRQELSQAVCSPLLKAAAFAEAKMNIDPSTYLPDILPVDCSGQIIDLADMWKSIGYRLGPNEFKSLRLFLQLVRPLNKTRLNDESLRLRMLRWQRQEAYGSSYLESLA